jgi:hypothetical protein
MVNEPANIPGRASEESTEEQLAVASEAGKAYADALRAMGDESGITAQVLGDMEIGVAIENAEGMYHLEGARLVWRNPTDEDAHVEVAVADARDGRFIPGLNVIVTLIGPKGEDLGTELVPFLWHPWLHHYGRNWRVAGPGEYEVHVHIDPPTFGRHDRMNGRRYAKARDATFRIHVEPGRKTA